MHITSRKPLLALSAAIFLTVPVNVSAQHPPTAGARAALQKATVETTAIIYVDYVTGLDNLINTIPAKQFRNNVAAFAKFSPVFSLPTAVLGEENEYYGTFLPEMKALVTAGAKTFPRTTISGYTPDLAQWLSKTGRRNVVIGGISIDNCTLHTSLDLLRAGYNVFVVVDVSGSNNRLAEDTAVRRLIMAGAVPVGWLTMMAELGGDFAGPYGKGMQQMVVGHWPASTVGPVEDLTPDGHGLQLPR